MEKLKQLGLDDEFGIYYDLIVHRKEVNSAKSEGRKEGKKQSATSIAKNFLKMGISKESIMQATGLSKKQITSLL